MKTGNLAEASLRDLLFVLSLLMVPAVVMALVSGLAHKSTSSKERGFESLSCHQFFAQGVSHLGFAQTTNRVRENCVLLLERTSHDISLAEFEASAPSPPS